MIHVIPFIPWGHVIVILNICDTKGPRLKVHINCSYAPNVFLQVSNNYASEPEVSLDVLAGACYSVPAHPLRAFVLILRSFAAMPPRRPPPHRPGDTPRSNRGPDLTNGWRGAVSSANFSSGAAPLSHTPPLPPPRLTLPPRSLSPQRRLPVGPSDQVMTRLAQALNDDVLPVMRGDPRAVAAVNKFWTHVRKVVCYVEDQVYEHVQRLYTVGQGPAPRPDTSQQIATFRREVDQRLLEAGLYQPPDTGPIESTYDLDHQWVMEKLVERQRDRELTHHNRLGCWLAITNDRYGSWNLRNTYYPDRDRRQRKIGVQIHLHVAAIIAKGDGIHLLNAVGKDSTHQVSHLCHNSRCFNPDHLVIETAALNKSRQRCNGHVITVGPDGTRFHPCNHHRTEHWLACILPEYQLDSRGYWEMGTDGKPQIRTGSAGVAARGFSPRRRV